MIGQAKKVFVLSPHPDDAEIACGGTIAKMVENGAEIISIVFSKVQERDSEMNEAGKLLGISKVLSLGLPQRNLHGHRQEILDTLIRLGEKHCPGLVIQPSFGDTHQDHQVVAEEAQRAFKRTNLLGFDGFWNHPSFIAQLFVSITDSQLSKKIRAVQCYRSQSHKCYTDRDYIKSLMLIRGAQMGLKYAEVFSVVRMVA